MKTKIIAAVFFLMAGVSVQGQVFRGGVNLANISVTNDGDVDDNKMLTSFQVGVIGNIKILPMLFFQPGVIFTGKGSKTQAGETTDATYFRATSNPYYIEIPANFVLKTPTGPIKLFAGAGPYIAIGVAGKNKVNGKFLGTSFSSEEKIEWSNDDPSTLDYEEGAGYGIMKRFDYGLNGIAGIEMSRSVLSVHYGHGLAKLQSGSNSSADDKSKHRVFSITLGFKL
ncbi:MAG: PorT family protein [Chitinophagaceae bacterium]|nr:PorT family protein [Chitinophagaceae bacterium]